MTDPDLDPEYSHIDPEAVEPTLDHPCDRRSISDAANLSVLAAARYKLEPGEQLPRTYHYHEQREELFYVRSGSLSVETPERTFEIDSDELFVAKPNSPHRAFNPGTAEETAVVLGFGAPNADIAHPYDSEDRDSAE